MGDPFKKVLHGQRLEIPADAYNAFLDAAKLVRARQHDTGQEGGREFRQTGIIRVRNGTGEDLPRYGVLALGEPIILPEDALQEFKNQIAFEGAKPGNAPRQERFAVALEPLAKDAIGRAIVAGVSAVQIDVVCEDDLYAELIADETNFLRSAANGVTRILWKEPGLGPKWAIVRLSERPRFAIFELSGQWLAASPPEPDGWAKMDGCRPVCFVAENGSYQSVSQYDVETVWHLAGYPPAERAGLIELQKATGLFPAKFSAGDWVWCHWHEQEGRWQLLGGYEDHWRFVLLTGLPRCGSALAQLVLHDGAGWKPVALTFLVYDSLGLATCDLCASSSSASSGNSSNGAVSEIPAGSFGVARRFADSGKWEVLALGQGCPSSSSSSSSSSDSNSSGSPSDSSSDSASSSSSGSSSSGSSSSSSSSTSSSSSSSSASGSSNSGSGSSSDSSSSLGTSIVTLRETDIRCESGKLNVYKRTITLTLQNGRLTKQEGVWAFSHQAGCCRCSGVDVPESFGELVIEGDGGGTHEPANVYSQIHIGALLIEGSGATSLTPAHAYPASGQLAVGGASVITFREPTRFQPASSVLLSLGGSSATSFHEASQHTPLPVGTLAVDGYGHSRLAKGATFAAAPTGALAIQGVAATSLREPGRFISASDGDLVISGVGAVIHLPGENSGGGEQTPIEFPYSALGNLILEGASIVLFNP